MAGIITTYAGTGTAGFSGDGGQADTAELSSSVLGLACDSYGNLYLADRANGRVRKVDYTYTTTVTEGNAISYQWYVNGVAITAATNSTYTYTPANNDSVRCVVICPAVWQWARYCQQQYGTHGCKTIRSACYSFSAIGEHLP